MKYRELIIIESYDPFDDPFTDEQKALLPPAVIHRAIALYAEVKSRPDRVGDTDVVDGYWIETHTLGCQAEGGLFGDDGWQRHFEMYDEFLNDPETIVAGDAGEGTFVRITPQQP